MADRFISPAPPATPYEREILTILIEECDEVSQRACKALRFGPTEIQPDQPLGNIERLSLEIGDLMAVIDVATSLELVRYDFVAEGMKRKREKLKKYLQTTPETVDAPDR